MKRKPVWFILSTAVAAAMAVALWRQSDLGSAARDLERQRTAARREGVPLEWEDLRRLVPPAPQSEKAAAPYRRGFETLEKAGNARNDFPERLLEAIIDGTAKPEDVAKVRLALAKVRPALAEIGQGAARPAVSFERHWELGPSLLFPELSQARIAARALTFRAILSKNPADAANDLRTVARLRTHIGSEPVVISPLVGAAIETDVHRGIRFLGRRGGTWAKAVEPVLKDLGPLPDLHRILAGEAVMGRHLSEEVAKHGPGAFSSMNAPTPVELRLSRFKPVRDAFESRIIAYWRKVYAALPNDPLDWRRSKAATSIPIPKHGPSQALLELATPMFGTLGDLAARQEAQRRLSRTALDLWQGRPPRLEKDPFGNGPLILRRNGHNWVLWSLGPDGLDNGGTPRKKNAVDDRYDLVIRHDG